MSSSVLGASVGSGGSSSGGPSGGVGGGGGGSPCGACKFLRRKCVIGCIFAPYFNSEQGAAHFVAVHKVFGASNVSKLLIQIPPHKRFDAVVTMCYEAQARIRDPVYGCVSHVFALQQQVVNLQNELTYLQGHLSTMELPTPPRFAVQNQMPITATFCVSNLQPSPSNNIIPASLSHRRSTTTGSPSSNRCRNTSLTNSSMSWWERALALASGVAALQEVETCNCWQGSSWIAMAQQQLARSLSRRHAHAEHRPICRWTG